MNRVSSWVIAIVLGSSVSASPAELPAEIQHLEAIAGDRDALIDAARRFHLQQQSLIDWDARLISEYSQQGQSELAREKQRELQRRLELLEAQWEWILARYPNDARANNYYGEFLFDYDGDQAGGLRHWLTAVELDDTCAPAHNNLGVHYFHTGNYAQGLKHLQRALELDKDSPDFLYNMAQMYLIHFDKLQHFLSMPKEKLYREAMQMSQKATKLAPEDFDILQDYAVNFYAAENFGVPVDWSEAAAAWQQALPRARTESERFYVLLNEGRVWMRASQPEKAVGPLESALALNRESDVAKQLLAQARGAAQ